MHFVLSRAVASGTVDCTFVRADMWLDFSQDLVSLWTKTCQWAEANAATVRLSPQLALPVSRRTDVHDPDQCDHRGLSKILSTKRAALLQAPRVHAVLHCHQHSNKEYGRCPGFQCLIVTKTEGHGLLKLDLLHVQTQLFCEHPFPLFENIWSNQEAGASCVNYSLSNVTMECFDLHQNRQRM